MALQIPPGFASVSVEMKHDNDPDPWAVTFGVDRGASTDPPSVDAFLIGSNFSAAFGSLISTATVVTGVDMRVGQDGGDPLVVRANLPMGRGLSSTPKLPQNCAALVSKFTALGGRKGRGRFFMPAVLTETQVGDTGGIIEPLYGNLTVAVTNFFESQRDGDAVAPPLPLVLLHNALVVDTPPPTLITSLQVSQTISTQRRRLR